MKNLVSGMLLAFFTVVFAGYSPVAHGAQDWKKEWDKVLAAARAEGAVTVAGPPQAAERKVIAKFRKAYPGIKLQYTGLRNSRFVSRVLTERNGGVYAWDIFIGGVSSGYKYIPAGFFQPIKPNLIFPDLTDDKTWANGFMAGFQDRSKKYMYAFTRYVTNLIKINRSIIPESELNSAQDLLNPKWKGRIVIYDPRRGGAGVLAMTALRKELGDQSLKTLLVDQDPVLSTNKRQFTEWVVRGKYPIGIGVVDAYLAPFWAEGLGKDVGNIKTKLRVITSGSGNLYVMARNPHPNATKVFANWLLSKKTQADWAKSASTNSRRLDVPSGSIATKPDLTKLDTYVDFNVEVGNQFMQDTKTMARKLRP